MISKRDYCNAVLIFFISFIFMLVFFGAFDPVIANAKTNAKVIRIVDGDTLVCSYEGVYEKVRMIGVDAPESVHPDRSRNTKWGKIVSSNVKKLLTGKRVFLKFDKQKRDRYNRLLAYVYINKKGKKKFVNKILVDKGLARAVYYAPNGRFRNALDAAQKIARKQKRGFWKSYREAFPL